MSMPAITIKDSELGEAHLGYSWSWHSHPHPHYRAELSGWGMSEYGRIAPDGYTGVQFEAVLYRYGCDILGLGALDPLQVMMVARKSIEQDAVRELERISGDAGMHH